MPPKIKAAELPPKDSEPDPCPAQSDAEGGSGAEEEEAGDDMFDVETIWEAVVNVDHESRKKKYLRYRIEWKTFVDDKWDTWEPLQNLDNCIDLVEAFWQKVEGGEPLGHLPAEGTAFKPRPEIQKQMMKERKERTRALKAEKARQRNEKLSEAAKKRSRKDGCFAASTDEAGPSSPPTKKPKQEASLPDKKGTQTKKRKRAVPATDASSSEDEPLAKKKPAAKEVKLEPDAESSEDDDVPLAQRVRTGRTTSVGPSRTSPAEPAGVPHATPAAPAPVEFQPPAPPPAPAPRQGSGTPSTSTGTVRSPSVEGRRPVIRPGRTAPKVQMMDEGWETLSRANVVKQRAVAGEGRPSLTLDTGRKSTSARAESPRDSKAPTPQASSAQGRKPIDFFGTGGKPHLPSFPRYTSAKAFSSMSPQPQLPEPSAGFAQAGPSGETADPWKASAVAYSRESSVASTSASPAPQEPIHTAALLVGSPGVHHCNVHFVEPTQPLPGKPRLKLTLSDKSQLRMKYELPAAYVVREMRDVWENMLQRARLVCADADAATVPADQDRVGQLSKLLRLKDKVGLVYLELGASNKASYALFLAPAHIPDLAHALKLPPPPSSDAPDRDHLYAVLVPLRRPNPVPPPPVLIPQDPNALLTKYDSVFARELLGFPEACGVLVRGRKFHVACVDRYSAEREQVVRMMKMYDGEEVDSDHRDEASVRFVHNAMATRIENMPNLAETKANPDVHFFLFGTNDEIHPSLWNTRHVYPRGGIISFTVKGIIEDPAAFRQIINIFRGNAWPEWQVFIHPGILWAARAKIKASLRAYDAGSAELNRYWDAHYELESMWLRRDSDVFIASAPPDITSPDAISWAGKMLETVSSKDPASPEDKDELLAHKDAAKWDAHLLDEMRKLQVHPALRESYRRFIIVVGTESRLTSEQRKGIEIRTTKSFLEEVKPALAL